MIQIKDDSHPDPNIQKLIFRGKVPQDSDVLENIFVNVCVIFKTSSL